MHARLVAESTLLEGGWGFAVSANEGLTALLAPPAFGSAVGRIFGHEDTVYATHTRCQGIARGPRPKGRHRKGGGPDGPLFEESSEGDGSRNGRARDLRPGLSIR